MGKTKVKEKLEKLANPLGIQFERVIVDTSREMRPGESQGNPWYFKSADEIDDNHRKNPENYLRLEVRKGEPQGLDAEIEIREKLNKAHVLWCELNVFWFQDVEKWLHANMPDTSITKVFFSPLTEAEVHERIKESGLTWEKVIEMEMMGRLIRRRAANLDNMSFEKLQVRAKGAVQEYAARDQFDCIIVNHQGEESPQWGSDYEFPTGEAAIVLQQFLRLYKI